MGYEELLAWVKTHRSVPPVDYEYMHHDKITLVLCQLVITYERGREDCSRPKAMSDFIDGTVRYILLR